jgi:hypothetical protein
VIIYTSHFLTYCRSTPKAAPEAAPKAAPKAAPRAAPKAAPKSAPKATAEAAPKATAEAAPKAACTTRQVSGAQTVLGMTSLHASLMNIIAVPQIAPRDC